MKTNIHQRLQQVRDALLALHKTLLETERVSYEKTMGAIKSPNHFLQLLTSDPWFAWLRPVSQLVVLMDEALDEKEPLTTSQVDELMSQTRLLLLASESGHGFSRHYFEALQSDPGVVLAHAEVVKALNSQRPAS